MEKPTHLHYSRKFYFAKLSLEGHFLYVNDLFAQRFSFLAKRFIGLDGTIAVSPHDYEAFHSALARCKNSEEGRATVMLRMAKQGNGCFLTDWEFALSTDENGNPDGFYCTGFETTDASLGNLRLEMKLQLLKLISDSSTESILLLDGNYKILAYNKPAEHLSFELYRRRYVAGDDFRKYVRPEAQQLFYQQYNSALRGITTEQVFDMSAEGGENLVLKVKMAPAYDDNSETVAGVTIITKDVTLLQDLNNRLNEVSTIQSHQVRRPVANMLSLVSLLEDCTLEPYAQQYVQLLKVSIGQMENEIRQIVKAARKV